MDLFGENKGSRTSREHTVRAVRWRSFRLSWNRLIFFIWHEYFKGAMHLQHSQAAFWTEWGLGWELTYINNCCLEEQGGNNSQKKDTVILKQAHEGRMGKKYEQRVVVLERIPYIFYLRSGLQRIRIFCRDKKWGWGQYLCPKSWS